MNARRMQIAVLAFCAVTLFAITAVLSAMLLGGDESADPSAADTVTETVTETVYIEQEPVEEEPSAETDDSYISGEGVYEVGRDMKPGTYRSTDNFQCYWEVSADPNGDTIISNDNNDGVAIVRVKRGQFFKSQNCSDWYRS